MAMNKRKRKRDKLQTDYPTDVRFDTKFDSDLPAFNGVRLKDLPVAMADIAELLNKTVLARLDRIECLLAGKERRRRGSDED